MDESTNRKEEMYSWILSEMRQAEAAGIAFQVDGQPYTVKEAERLHMVMEEGYYMKSYEDDGEGKIIGIDFEHIDTV